jgi:putative ABC transport system substrate-binding protein
VWLLFLPGLAANSVEEIGHTPRIGILTPGDVEYYERAFVEELAVHGYRQGETVTIERRMTGGNLDSGSKLAEELVALDLDVIYTAPGILARHVVTAESRAGKRTPVVVLTWDPVGEGLVSSAAHPGGHVTGVAGVHAPGDLMAKQFQLARDLVPGARRIACLLDGSWHKEFNAQTRSALTQAGKLTGVRVSFIELPSPGNVNQALNSAWRRRPDVMLIPSAVVFTTVQPQLLEFAATHRLPVVYGDEIFPYEGGLMSYGASVAEMMRRGARMVVTILRGADPATIPIDYNTRFRLVINARAAKSLGLNVPALLLEQADEVVK